MVKEFFRDKAPARLLMIAAVLLLFASQFFYYLDDPSTGMLSIGSDFSTTGYYWLGAQGTGWELHPQAYVVLVVLGFALLRDDVAEHRLFLRFGYWACVVLVIASTAPGAYFRSLGGGMGGIAVLIAFGAAILHQISNKTLAPTPPAE